MKVNSRFLLAAKKTILLGASLHLSVLAIYAILNTDLSLLNIFNILDLSLFFPSLSMGTGPFILSYLLLLGVFGCFLILDKKSK